MRLSPLLLLLWACGSEPEPFALRFEAVAGSAAVDCGAPITGLGPSGMHSVGLSDLRFFVSNVELLDADGEPVETTFDSDEFQYQGQSGWVALVDLTSTGSGTCDATAITFSEGTSRTHEAVTGTTLVSEVDTVRFDVGVPQALMKEVIGSTSVEAAPSPLNELYWSWASGYRHFVFNMTVSDGMTDGEGYLHLGSTDCAAEGELALESREQCGFLNTPRVELSGFDLAEGHVAVDLAAALSNLDFLSPVYDPKTFEVIGETVGVECHSSPMQDDCPTVFGNFGVDITTGDATAAADDVFGAH